MVIVETMEAPGLDPAPKDHLLKGPIMRCSRNWSRSLGIAWLGMILVVSLALHGPRAAAQDLVARTEARSASDEQKGFHLPPGFEIQLVASEPDVLKPMNLAFDDRGRLWVTDSTEYPFPAAEGAKTRDGVRILEDFGPDGKARKITTFTEGLNIPIGVLPRGRGAFVYSIPRIWWMEDTDGDGKADGKSPAYQTFGFRDTHGMASAFTWGFDGWIHACHGFSNDSTIQGADGKTIKLNSGNTYRFRPDGSHVEQFTWGQVNPFGLAFDALGNLFSCDCHSQPVYCLLRGGYYPSFGKPHDGLGYAPEMTTNDHGSTGIAGISVYEADHFPKEYQGTVFIGNPVTSRINHDRLEWVGSTPGVKRLPDFLTSDDPWFRPVDLELGPDGALYLSDFYNRIIGHYEVPLTHPGRDRSSGRIWRVVYTGKNRELPVPTMPRADWSKASVAELIADLGHANLAVRIKAANQLVDRGGRGVIDAVVADDAAANGEGSVVAKVHRAWVLHRLGALEATTLTALAGHPEQLGRVHAMRILAEKEVWSPEERDLAGKGLVDTDPLVRRCAADAMGRHPKVEQIPALIALVRGCDPADTHLRHVARMALRDQLLNPASWSQLPAESADQVVIRDVALGVANRDAARFLLRLLEQSQGELPAHDQVIRHVARHGDGSTDARLLGVLEARHEGRGWRLAALRALGEGLRQRGAVLDDAARNWARSVVEDALASDAGADRREALDQAAELRLTSALAKIEALAGRGDLDGPTRQAAFRALAALDLDRAIKRLGDVARSSSESSTAREQAIQVLGTTGTAPARQVLLDALPVAPATTQRAIAISLAGSRDGARSLLDAITAGKASARLIQDSAVDVRLALSGLEDYKTRAADLLKGLPPPDARVNQEIERRKRGLLGERSDLSRGALAFEKHCGACHQVRGKGGRVGPQLDGVGVRGPDRLLEDLLDPSRNVDQAFRTTNLALKDGRLVSGLLLREEGEVLVVADSQGREAAVPKAEVEARSVVPLSPMPANIVDQIPAEDFPHLLGFLLSQAEPPR